MNKILTFLFALSVIFITGKAPAQIVSLYAGIPQDTGYDPVGVDRLSCHFAYPYGLAFDSKGNLWISNQGGDYDGNGEKGHTIGVILKSSGMYYNRAGYYGRACLRDGNSIGMAGPRFKSPSGIAIGPGDTIYVADRDNHCIRKITPLTTLGNPQTTSIFAGKYSYVSPLDLCYFTYPGYADGPAKVAQFDEPTDIDFDANGNLYVADKNNHCIRKITPEGIVSTIAGSPGNPGLVNGNALTQAKFSYPIGIMVESNGDILVTEWGNADIRKISGGVVSTLMENSFDSVWFWNPTDLFRDQRNWLYICDAYRILKRVGGQTTVFAGGPYHNGYAGYVNGLDTSARFDNMRQVVVDPTDYHNVFVADQMNQVIRKIAICDPYKPTVSYTGPLSTCTGDTINLKGPNGYSAYKWSTGETTQNIKLYGKQAKEITLTVTNANSCKGTSDPLYIEINDLYPVVTPTGPLTFCTGGSVTLVGPSGMDNYYWTKDGNLYDQGASKQSISVNQTGVYRLRGTKGNCSGYSQNMTVTVSNHLVPYLSFSGDTNLCSGKAVVAYTVNNFSQYKWYKWGTQISTSSQITINDSGNYRVWADDGKGCNGYSYWVHITKNVSPSKPTISFLAKDSVLVSSSATNNQWYRDGVLLPGATAQAIYASVHGYYSVEVSNASGCKTMSDLYHVGNIGIDENRQIANTAIYPNPAEEMFNLSMYLKSGGEINIKVIDMLGKVFLNDNRTLSSGNFENQYGVSNLEKGIYFVVITLNGETNVLKFIKQ